MLLLLCNSNQYLTHSATDTVLDFSVYTDMCYKQVSKPQPGLIIIFKFPVSKKIKDVFLTASCIYIYIYLEYTYNPKICL